MDGAPFKSPLPGKAETGKHFPGIGLQKPVLVLPKTVGG